MASQSTAPGWVWGLAVAGAVYLFYKAKTTTQSVTNDVAQLIANWWLTLFPNPPPMNVLGNVSFPGGVLVPLSQLTVKTDGAFPPNVFVSYQGSVYRLSPSDEQGNWPATLVTAVPGQ